MKYRLNFNNINTVAQLIDGDIQSVLENIFNLEYCGREILINIKELVIGFEENFYTGNIINDKEDISEIITLIDKYISEDDVICEIKKFKCKNCDKKFIYKQDINYMKSNSKVIKNFYEALRTCGNLLNKCNINVLLVPGMEKTALNDTLISEQLERHVYIPAENSCLILQPKELPKKDELYIYNVSKNINVAFNKINLWPGVLLWNKKEKVFIPLSEKKGKKELITLFDLINSNNGNISEIMKKYKESKDIYEESEDIHDKYYYILHLSDLHFGKENINEQKDSLITFIDEINKELEDDKIQTTIISGDLVDSPKSKYYEKFHNFDDELKGIVNKSPIKVYGNHDKYIKGNFILNFMYKIYNKFGENSNDCNKQVDNKILNFMCTKCNKIIKFLDPCNEYVDNIEIVENLKLIIIKFDSNAKYAGLFAEGKIGKKQFKKIETELNKIENRDKYLCVAVLHHHPVEIKTENKIQENFIEKVFNYIDKLQEKALILEDAPEFIKWINKMNIKVVLHGHKHVYNFNNENAADIIGCGSSIGKVDITDRDDKNYLTFNLIKVNKNTNTPEVCLTYSKSVNDNGLHLIIRMMGEYKFKI